jgi:hypothetical protein
VPVTLPADAAAWLSDVFSQANRATSGQINWNPNVWETVLDQSFITSLASSSHTQVRFPSGWGIVIETHFLGGGRHLNNWEVADIGFLVTWQAGACARKQHCSSQNVSTP